MNNMFEVITAPKTKNGESIQTGRKSEVRYLGRRVNGSLTVGR